MRTLVYVRWMDASQQEGPLSERQFKRGMVLESAGLLAGETKYVLTLALDWDADGEEWRDVRHIPKVLIRNVKRFKVDS